MTSTPTLTAPLTDLTPHLIAHAFAAPSAAATWLRTTIADGEIGGLVTLPRALRNVSSAAATRLITVDLRRQGYPQAATPGQVHAARPAAKVAALLEAADRHLRSHLRTAMGGHGGVHRGHRPADPADEEGVELAALRPPA